MAVRSAVSYLLTIQWPLYNMYINEHTCSISIQEYLMLFVTEPLHYS